MTQARSAGRRVGAMTVALAVAVSVMVAAQDERAQTLQRQTEGLRGKLLLIHGSGDDSVHYQGTEQLVDRLVSLGKRFDLMVYPNRTHAIAEGSGTSAHVHTLIARYFLDHLPPGAR